MERRNFLKTAASLVAFSSISSDRQSIQLESAVAQSDIEIANLVGLGVIPNQTTQQISHAFNDTKYKTWRQGNLTGLHIRRGNDGPLITFYDSGKYLLRARSVDVYRETHKDFLHVLTQAGISIEDSTFELINMVGTSEVETDHETIDLAALHSEISQDPLNYTFNRPSDYSPNIFPNSPPTKILRRRHTDCLP